MRGSVRAVSDRDVRPNHFAGLGVLDAQGSGIAFGVVGNGQLGEFERIEAIGTDEEKEAFWRCELLLASQRHVVFHSVKRSNRVPEPMSLAVTSGASSKPRPREGQGSSLC